MTADRSTVTGDGPALAVWERGRTGDPTVVLVHGYPDTHVVWDAVAEDLASDHHVVVYDVRGAGESGEPASPEGYRSEHLVADLAAVLDATSPDVPVHLVGHDWGSIQAWEAVLSGTLDDRIASYTSISGPPLDHVGRWMRERRSEGASGLRRLVSQGMRSWYIAFFKVPAAADAAWRSSPRLFRKYLRGVEGFGPGHEPAATLPRDGENGLELYRQNIGSGLRSPAPRTTQIPVLLVVLRRDRYVTSALLDGLEQTAPRLERTEIDGTHWSVVTRAGEVAGAIRRHVAATSQAG